MDPTQSSATVSPSYRSSQRVSGTSWVLLQKDDELAATIQQRGVQPESNTSLWACLSRFVSHKDGCPIPQQTLAANAGIFLAAGFETTAHTISWALFELAANPSMQVWTLQRVLISACTLCGANDLPEL